MLGGTSEIAHELCIELVKSGTKKIHLVSRQPDNNNSFIENIIRNFNVWHVVCFLNAEASRQQRL